MGNYLQNFRGNTDRATTETTRRAGWLPIGGICIFLVILFLIAVTIVCSLIPLYLLKKDVNAAVNSDANLNMVFATDFRSSTGESVTNVDSLTRQFNDKMGYLNDVLSVKSVSLETGSITSTKKKKRQLRDAVSCNATQAGSSISQGDKIRMIIIINECPKTKCKTAYCITQCILPTKADIQSKLSSTTFTIVTNLASYTVSSRFCGFDVVLLAVSTTISPTITATTTSTTTTTLLVWVLTGSMSTARKCHTQVTLTNGNVLVAGGTPDGSTPLSSAEVYNPSTGLWTTTGILSSARAVHIASGLVNGNVLVAGGTADGSTGLSSAEVYNLSTGLWITTSTMSATRLLHTASKLTNRTILVAGGPPNLISALNSAEVYG
ncbi:unnamed protein product [Adineta steineri]|uniref:Uncharacterized protein n=1 Tax=Adineta steineri TaxID=433720 RepID=A0A815DEU0_9BILA|nr:unnamed protein product [Adineta steineri]CAF4020598.1 unnamed protein product [Adineta steineri]